MLEHLLPLFASQQGSGTHKLLAATQTRAETGARAGAEFADACRDIGAGTLDCVLPCARVVAMMLATRAASAAAMAQGICSNAAHGIRANA
jgi:hypothetical protein